MADGIRASRFRGPRAGPTPGVPRCAAPWALVALAALGFAPLRAAPGVIRVNCGGGTFVDACGRAWQADLGFDGGTSEIAQVPIAGTGTPALYQTGRWSQAALQYSIPAGGTLPQDLAVVLHFAEIFTGNCQVGRRVFEVWIEGERVSDGLDIYREVGCQTALSRTYVVRAEGETVEIALIPVKGSPKISGIEVFLDPDAIERCAPCPSELTCEVGEGPSVLLHWRNRSLDYASIVVVRDGTPIDEIDRHEQEYTDLWIETGLHTYRLFVPDGPSGACESETCSVLVGPPYHVNCGGEAWEDPGGTIWWPEPGPEQGTAYVVQDTEIFGTDKQPLFRSQRFGTADGPPLSYSLWVPEGMWRVTLYLAEVYDRIDEIGERTFDVWIAGGRTAEEVDIFASSGFAAATSLCWDVSVPAGPIDIALLGREGVPALAGIEIDESPSPVPSLAGLSAGLTEDGTASFSWSVLPEPADRIRVARDGHPLTEAAGGATSWEDPDMPDGAHEYTFVPIRFGETACPRRIALELPPLWIQCGGYGFQTADGVDWGADRWFRGGERRRIDPPPPIEGTSEARLYSSWRRGSAAAPSIRYDIPAVRGRLYRVDLHFADIEPGRTGATFAVTVNDTVVREALDVSATFGLCVAGVIAVEVAPPGGEIAIVLDPVAGTPRISAIEVRPVEGFLRGDVSVDGTFALDDPIRILMYLFADGAAPVCPDAADADDSGDFTIGDAIVLLNHLFGDAPAPPVPSLERCGADPTPDALPPCDYRACPPRVVEAMR
ncbi:MAG: hypothetical protein JXP34_06240 [Planctomycetes bacterium]|nr:hypothetical protein [Planctomycetota bacterium]